MPAFSDRQGTTWCSAVDSWYRPGISCWCLALMFVLLQKAVIGAVLLLAKSALTKHPQCKKCCLSVRRLFGWLVALPTRKPAQAPFSATSLLKQLGSPLLWAVWLTCFKVTVGVRGAGSVLWMLRFHLTKVRFRGSPGAAWLAGELRYYHTDKPSF